MAAIEREVSPDLASARLMLEQWGIWTRSCNAGPIRVKSWVGVLMERFVEQIGRHNTQYLDDSECEAFDLNVMRKVKEINALAFEALKLYYAYPSSDEAQAVSKAHLAKRMKIGRNVAAKALYDGEQMVAIGLALWH